MVVHLETGTWHPDIPPRFYQKTLTMLSDLQIEIQSTINNGDLEVESLASNNLITYNTLYEQFQSIELFRYEVIINYGDPEHYFNRKIQRIYNEIKNTQVPPLITTISNSESYYWAHPYFEIIAVPAGEEKNLLNLPDLYHEISHLIFKQYNSYLLGDFVQQVKSYFDAEITRVTDEQRPSKYLSFYRDKLKKWLNGWIEEFTCDLIATYLVGPAYAWTNLKLSTISSGSDKIYIDSQSHPSDEARMRAIFDMLRINGYGNEVIGIETCWNNFLHATSNPIPDDYQFIFPNHLLESLANKVLDGCKVIGLNNYEEQINEFKTPISKTLNDAWEALRFNPRAFDVWEADEIKRIRTSLGL